MSVSSVLNDSNVKKLIETMDLKEPKDFLEISDYYYDGENIVISNVNVVDRDGKLKRKANLSKVVDHLKNINVKFL